MNRSFVLVQIHSSGHFIIATDLAMTACTFKAHFDSPSWTFSKIFASVKRNFKCTSGIYTTVYSRTGIRLREVGPST